MFLGLSENGGLTMGTGPDCFWTNPLVKTPKTLRTPLESVWLVTAYGVLWGYVEFT
jgi:hypothetical protein